MQQMTASHAKQNFGELLDALARGPVAIERHKRIKAIVCTPEAFLEKSGEDAQLAERRAARAAQRLIEKDRLIRHQQWAIELLLMPEAQRAQRLDLARAEVGRWRRDRLCSPDYADRWDELLSQPVAQLARAMGSESLDWGVALRQNSPWPAVVP